MTERDKAMEYQPTTGYEAAANLREREWHAEAYRQSGLSPSGSVLEEKVFRVCDLCDTAFTGTEHECLAPVAEGLLREVLKTIVAVASGEKQVIPVSDDGTATMAWIWKFAREALHENAVREQEKRATKIAESSGLNFQQLRHANVTRCEESFHPINGWTPWDWSNAMAGEVGEACNLTKKMARVWPSNKLIKKWDDKTLPQLEAELALELADVVIYADLLATRIGRLLEDCIREKFNRTSEKIGSDVRLLAAKPREKS